MYCMQTEFHTYFSFQCDLLKVYCSIKFSPGMARHFHMNSVCGGGTTVQKRRRTDEGFIKRAMPVDFSVRMYRTWMHCDAQLHSYWLRILFSVHSLAGIRLARGILDPDFLSVSSFSHVHATSSFQGTRVTMLYSICKHVALVCPFSDVPDSLGWLYLIGS